MSTYFIKLALRGVSPMIWRRLCLSGKTSLTQLHHAIQIAYGWDDDYLHQFHIHGKDYGTQNSAGFILAFGADETLIEQFAFDAGDKFFYAYNFFKHDVIDIRIEKVKHALSCNPIPYCLQGKGMPDVHPGDELESIRDLLKAIADADETTTFDDIRPCIDALNAVRFDRDHINHRLQSELN